MRNSCCCRSALPLLALVLFETTWRFEFLVAFLARPAFWSSKANLVGMVCTHMFGHSARPPAGVVTAVNGTKMCWFWRICWPIFTDFFVFRASPVTWLWFVTVSTSYRATAKTMNSFTMVFHVNTLIRYNVTDLYFWLAFIIEVIFIFVLYVTVIVPFTEMMPYMRPQVALRP